MDNETDTVDARWLLEKLNNEKAVTLIPAMAVMGCLMLLGLLGNGMVGFFYGCKSKTTPATTFILSLALFDLLACSVAIPVEISDMALYYMFESVAACRLLTFVNHFSVIGSAFTLSAIAVDRYKRICKPFDKQLSLNQARIICAVCAGLGILLGWPAIALYNVEKVNVNNTYNVSLVGYDCTSVKNPDYEPYAWAFNVVQFAGFIGVTLALIIAYFLVGRQLYKHKKFRFYVAKNRLRKTSSGTNITSGDYTSERVVSSSLPVSIPEEMDEEELEEVEFDGPPDDPPLMRESIPDLRELLYFQSDLDESRPGSAIYGLTEVDTDRPRSRPNSGRPTSAGRPPSHTSVCTGISGTSGKSKKSVMSLKSVTICDKSENQIFSIEPRDKGNQPTWRPSSGRSDSTWSNSITRPNSVSSLASIPRTASLTSAGGRSDRPGSGDSIASRSNAIYPEIPTTGSKRMRNVHRSNSDGNISKQLRPKINPLRKTASNDSAKFNKSKGPTSPTRKSSLRRTGSNDSAKMNTDTDNLKDLRMKMLDINTIKYTIIMIIIASVFILSCLPYLALAVYRTYAEDDFVYTLNDAQLVWFQLGIRSYFLNGAINPLIYGFFNSQFRDFFYNAWCCCCKRKKKAAEDTGEKDFSDSKTHSTNRNSLTK